MKNLEAEKHFVWSKIWISEKPLELVKTASMPNFER